MYQIEIFILFVCLFISVVYDFKYGKIPNRIHIFLFTISIIFAVLEKSLLNLAISFLVSFIVVIVFWVLKVLKAGDCKLFIGLACIAGLEKFFQSFAFSLMCGAFVGVVFLILKKEFFSRMKRLYFYIQGLIIQKKFVPYQPQSDTENEFPFAVYILIGSFISFFFSGL